ncbi:MAG: efflux RND transporter periplasmic adaptor subunit [Acidobacteriaceae bacterium]
MNLKKILIIAAIVVGLGGIVAFSIVRSQSGVTKVILGKAVNEDLTSIVSGTGQIKPKTYVNVGATAFGRITHLYVKEGDHVKKGEILATVENVQPEATVAAQQATIASSKTDVSSYIAAEKTAIANLDQAEADLQQKKLDYQRAEALYHAQLIAKQDFDAKKAAYDVAVATIAQREAAIGQAKAQTASARSHVNQAIATQRSNYDSLDKTISRAPFDALVTNVPVREGETVVVGIQNAEGSTLMTLADMSVITAEVKVDETDIVNVALGQTANVTVDALPGKVFKGHVTEVGDQALLRTTGIATSQSTTGTEEAKDFKVVITLDDPSSELRPGLSATAKIVTAHKPDALAIPIQALTLRDPNSLKEESKSAAAIPSSTAAKSQPIQGVFVVHRKGSRLTAQFVPVQTGITGTTDIEITSGLKAGDEIITGSYKVLRTLKNGARVKRDTTPMTINSDSSS